MLIVISDRAHVAHKRSFYFLIADQAENSIINHRTNMDIIMDFALLGLFGAGLVYGFIVLKAKLPNNTAFKSATAMALIGAFLLVWVVGAVGIFGEPDLTELASLVVGAVVAGITRFKPKGLSISMFAAGATQIVAAVFAGFTGVLSAEYWIQELIMNGIFVGIFLGSALLCRRAASQVELLEPLHK